MPFWNKDNKNKNNDKNNEEIKEVDKLPKNPKKGEKFRLNTKTGLTTFEATGIEGFGKWKIIKKEKKRD